MTKDILYIFYAVILGVVAFLTHEIVTFVMLGFILLALNNILKTLQDIRGELKQKNATLTSKAESAITPNRQPE